jgi:lysozyme family protein
MAKIALTQALKEEYERLFNTCTIANQWIKTVEATISEILKNKAAYEAVAGSLGIPWYFISVIHNMESGLNFTRHLHNGDPLSGRTIHVPEGRPKTGSPPFAWEESAKDALTMRGLNAKKDWSLPGALYQIEGYNGWGYRLYHAHVLSPYLWSYSNHYSSGKYVEDGRWSDTSVSKQCGAAVLLRRMVELNYVEFSDQPLPGAGTDPLVVKYSKSRSRYPLIEKQAEDLQRWLNTFPGIFVKVDGIPGEKTSDAYKRVTGSYLPADPRGGIS